MSHEQEEVCGLCIAHSKDLPQTSEACYNDCEVLANTDLVMLDGELLGGMLDKIVSCSICCRRCCWP